jgi:phosphatidylinositol alpha-mannosyltransferase
VVVDHLGRRPQVIPNGIRAAEFDPSADRAELLTESEGRGGPGPWRAGDHPRLVFLGRLDEPRKGLDVLVAALPTIMGRHPDLEIVIAGQGRLSRLRRRLPAGCTVLGEIDDTTRADLLRRTDLFVAPHVARESFGIVLIEALAAGASVIASDLPAFTDLLAGGQDPLGFLFPAGDPGGLACTVDRALAADRQRLNARARAAVQRYDWSVVGPAVRAVYAGLLSR